MSSSSGKRKLSDRVAKLTSSKSNDTTSFEDFAFGSTKQITTVAKKKSKSISNSSPIKPKRKLKKAASLIDRVEGDKLYWLMKCEPEDLTIEELRANGKDSWDGVRNAEARNHMISMRVGDEAFFYQSNVKRPSILGTMKVIKEAYTDHTQFDPKDPHYDPSSDKNDPKWKMVDVQLLKQFKTPVYRDTIKEDSFLSSSMDLFRRNRLSVTKVKKEEWEKILKLANE